MKKKSCMIAGHLEYGSHLEFQIMFSINRIDPQMIFSNL